MVIRKAVPGKTLNINPLQCKELTACETPATGGGMNITPATVAGANHKGGEEKSVFAWEHIEKLTGDCEKTGGVEKNILAFGGLIFT